MSLGFRVAPEPFRCAGWLLLPFAMVAACGCEAASKLTDVSVAPPASWRPVNPADVVVPGTALAAWAGPQGSSLVLFRSLPIPDPSAQSLATDLTNRLTNLPGLTVDVKRTEPQAGQEAARVEVVAPGTGDALAPTGTGEPVAPKGKALTPTRRVALAFPRPNDTLWLTWHYPEAARAEIDPEVAATLKSLQLGPGGQTAAQARSY